MKQPKQTFELWLEDHVRRFKTAREFAAKMSAILKVRFDESKISRWRRNNLLPQSIEIAALAEVTGTPIEELLLMVWDADRRRLEARISMAVTGRKAESGADSYRLTSKPPQKASRLMRGGALAPALAV